ncbi:MAG: hypothetical protein HY698_06945 [Deltaproteobacteria bacterium]|nr:hypothetical protein [Deltaproteobacteria bacterium]
MGRVDFGPDLAPALASVLGFALAFALSGRPVSWDLLLALAFTETLAFPTAFPLARGSFSVPFCAAFACVTVLLGERVALADFLFVALRPVVDFLVVGIG